ncbi:hypothetical protein D3C71_1448590 [compost metagenome]
MVPAHALGGGDEHFQRRVARARAHAGQARVDTVAAFFHRDDGVGHAQAQVVVGVHARLGLGLQNILERAEPVAHILHAQGPAGVDHVAHGRAIAFHQLGLLGQALRRLHVAHHQKAHGFHAQMARIFDVLARDIGLGAVRGDAHHAHAGVVRGLEVMDGANARQQQRGDLGVLDHAGHGFYPLKIGMRAKAVVEARALQTVAMRDFDGIDLGRIERLGDLFDLGDAVLVANRVAAVAQGHVGDIEFLVHGGSSGGRARLRRE